MTELLSSETWKSSELPLDVTGSSKPSYESWLFYIGCRLLGESVTAVPPTVTYSEADKTWRITWIAAKRAYSVRIKEKEMVPAKRRAFLTDRDLEEAEIENQRANLHAEIMACFAGTTTGELEDGMTGDLGSGIAELLRAHKDLAIRLLAALIYSKQVPEEALSHALRWIGRIKHEETYRERLWLLRNCLKLSSPVIRDGAGLGLAALGSPQAIPSLREAIEMEKIPSLREDLEKVLRRLESKP